MQPLTLSRAKPSLPVLGTPLVVAAARLLRSAGVREIVVNLSHQGSSVRRALEERLNDPRPGSTLSGCTFRYSEETTLMGTGGGIGRVARWLAEDGPAVVVNSDFLSDIDLARVIAEHSERAKPANDSSSSVGGDLLATMVVIDPAGPFPGELWIDETERIVAVRNIPAGPISDLTQTGDTLVRSGAPSGTGTKTRGGETAYLGPLEYTGVQILEPELLAMFPDRHCDSVRDIYPPLIATRRLGVHRHPGYWWEFGSLDRFLCGQIDLARNSRGYGAEGRFESPTPGALVWIADGGELSSSAIVRGVAVLGAGARVRAGSILEDTVVLDRAQISIGCRLTRTIVGPDTMLTGGSTFSNAAVASTPCSQPAGIAGSAETPGGRPAPPEGCRIESDLWVKEIPR